MATMTKASPQRWVQRQAERYRDGEERPLAGYLTLMGVYSAGTLAASAVAKALGRKAPARLTPWDVTQMAIATQRISRLIAKDPVTSPLRAPFTSYRGLSAPGELSEEVRGHGVQHSVGELLTCPMCLSQWVATSLSLGLVVAPTLTRMMMATFTAVGVSDFLQHLYVKLQQATD